MGGKIKVLVVDDSKFFRTAIISSLNKLPDIEVVGEAYDPYEASDLINSFDPDVITLDIQMPYMNGMEFLKILTPQLNTPVIVVSSQVRASAEALSAGASVFLPKPGSQNELSKFVAELARHIRSLTGRAQPAGGETGPAVQPRVPVKFNGIVAIGASAGGTQTTTAILKTLPADFPGIVIVQHMPQDFTRTYAESLNKECRFSVKEAEDGDIIKRGQCFVAPGGDRHCEVIKRDRQYCVRLKQGAKVSGHCPSVDVLFHSVARAAPGIEALGVILTGMGADGARGLYEMRRGGSHTIGQDEKTSIVYGMPKVAYDIGAVAVQAPLENISTLMLKYVDGRY